MTFITAAHYEITFKRPHWNNSEGFIDAMEDVCADYKALNSSDGLWGNSSIEGYVKHDYQVIAQGQVDLTMLWPGTHPEAVASSGREGGGGGDGGG